MRDGALTMWPAAAYCDILEKRQSPKATGAPREEEVLMVDVASPNQALAKVRVRSITMPCRMPPSSVATRVQLAPPLPLRSVENGHCRNRRFSMNSAGIFEQISLVFSIACHRRKA
jgi:Putative lumazine-binding